MARAAFTLAVMVAVLAVGLVSAALVRPCGNWQLYKQCGEKWSNHELGTGDLTICQAGCAMSCVAMSMSTYQERIHRGSVNPGTLNGWLTANHGYEDGDLIIWDSIAKLGRLHMTEATTSLSTDEIRKHIHRCNPVIANVREGTHWVLLVGYDDAVDGTFLVNDPGFDQSSYQYSGMSHFVVYSNSTGSLLPTQHQQAPALLQKAVYASGN